MTQVSFIRLTEDSGTFSRAILWSSSSLPALVLAQQRATVGALVLCHIEPGHAEGDHGTGPTPAKKHYAPLVLTIVTLN